jgi:hypothetical protein
MRLDQMPRSLPSFTVEEAGVMRAAAQRFFRPIVYTGIRYLAIGRHSVRVVPLPFSCGYCSLRRGWEQCFAMPPEISCRSLYW